MILQGDARHIPLADETVQCCVTSPPYWGLRDYGLNGSGIGLEPTLDEYLENMLTVSREVKRVLRPDGCLFLNLGDAYNGSGGAGGDYNKGGLKEGQPRFPGRNIGALKPKDLIGLPWRVAFALQTDGWYLRSDIIWHKPNPMPESVRDRPARSHEYVFLLTKQAKYFYDNDAVREPHAEPDRGKGRSGGGTRKPGMEEEQYVTRWALDESGGRSYNPAGRNRRTVWTIPTQPYRGAHFATYPEKLVETCILAGTSSKACGVCGASWARDIDRKDNYEKREPAHAPNSAPSKVDSTGWKPPTITDNGWRPSCDHDDDAGRCLVLDPFCGSGTTGAVAKRLGRDFVGLDMSAEYLKLARERIGAVTMGMAL